MGIAIVVTKELKENKIVTISASKTFSGNIFFFSTKKLLLS